MMEAVCFLCQDYKSFVGHDTSNCPKSECKNCGQKGHFRMNCKFKTLDTPWYKSNKIRKQTRKNPNSTRKNYQVNIMNLIKDLTNMN